MKNNNESGGFALLCCFLALGLSAVIAFITYLLPLINSGIEVNGNVIDILNFIFKISALVGLSAGALAYAARRGYIVKILTALFVLVFAVAIILNIIGII